jgi:peptidoglycan hydrolase-like protein with peptidoglycan-binding domain
MRTLTALLVLLGTIALTRADQTIESAQQTLKDQGFYYGEITGEKNADTIAAIRRYQIRNGLQVTGELNDETLRSLRSSASASSQPAATNPPSPTPDTSDLRDDSSHEAAVATPSTTTPQDRQSYPRPPESAPSTAGGSFAGTPFDGAPPDVQRNVVVSAQTALARLGLYRNEIDGVFGPSLEFSLRAYQARVGLPITGRLDLETLAALALLPGANTPVYTSPRRIWRGRPVPEPPVRGEWVRP